MPQRPRFLNCTGSFQKPRGNFRRDYEWVLLLASSSRKIMSRAPSNEYPVIQISTGTENLGHLDTQGKICTTPLPPNPDRSHRKRLQNHLTSQCDRVQLRRGRRRGGGAGGEESAAAVEGSRSAWPPSPWEAVVAVCVRSVAPTGLLTAPVGVGEYAADVTEASEFWFLFYSRTPKIF